MLNYDIFAISKVLPTVSKIRFSCIFSTWFPLRRSEIRSQKSEVRASEEKDPDS